MAKKAAKTSAKKSKAKKKSAAPLRIKSVIAIANEMPPGPHRLHVRAIVEVPTPGYTAKLVKAVPQGINPAILLLKVVTTKLPGIWPQVVVDTLAAYDDNKYKGNYKQVTVLYGNQSKTVRVQIVV
jgi:hypothetical protein